MSTTPEVDQLLANIGDPAGKSLSDVEHALRHDRVGDAVRAVDQRLAVVSSTAPADPATDRLWYDTTEGVLKRWTGTEWETSGSGILRSDDSPVYVPIEGEPALGAPTRDLYNRTIVINMNSGADRIWAFPAVEIPPSWSTFDAYLGWAKSNTATDDIDWQLRSAFHSPTSIINSPSGVVSVPATPAAEDEIVPTQLVAGRAVSPWPVTFNLYRVSGGATNARVVWLRLEKAS